MRFRLVCLEISALACGQRGIISLNMVSTATMPAAREVSSMIFDWPDLEAMQQHVYQHYSPL